MGDSEIFPHVHEKLIYDEEAMKISRKKILKNVLEMFNIHMEKLLNWILCPQSVSGSLKV